MRSEGIAISPAALAKVSEKTRKRLDTRA
jgi:hypothetical protein